MRWRVACTIIGSMALLLSGCRKERTAPRWDVDLLGPLITSSFTISDIIPDSELVVGNGGALTLRYTIPLFALDIDTVFLVPDTNLSYTYSLPVPGPIAVAAGAQFFVQNDVTRFDLNEIELRELWVRSGSLDLEVRNGIPGDVLGRITLPTAVLNGQPLMLERTAPAGTSALPSITTASQPLDGYRLDLRGPLLGEVNTLTTRVDGFMDPDGSGGTLTDEDTLRAIVSYRDILADYARGYFGQPGITVGPQSDGITAFEEFIGGSFDINTLHAELRITNGVGIDAQVFLGTVTGENTASGQSVTLQHAVFNGPINLTRAQDLFGTFQATTHSTFLTETNSNLDEFVEIMPDRVTYDLVMNVNPLGDISNGNDFFYRDSRLKADLLLDVPLDVITTGLTLQSTFDPDLPGSADGHAIQEGALKLFVENGFPLEAELIMDIVDLQGNVVENVPVTGTVAPALLGPDRLVQTRVSSVLEAYLTPERTDLLYQDTRIRITLIFSTSDQSEHLVILDSYALDLQITVNGNYIVNGDR